MREWTKTLGIVVSMRPGDIHTHVFAQQFPILLADGKLNPILAEARARGVIFDVGHGAGSFWFRNAVPAVKQGFIPDSISTDLHTGNFTVLSMTQVMSKFLAMRVPLQDLIRRSTVNPAQEIHRPELGTLSVGKEADFLRFQSFRGGVPCCRAMLLAVLAPLNEDRSTRGPLDASLSNTRAGSEPLATFSTLLLLSTGYKSVDLICSALKRFVLIVQPLQFHYIPSAVKHSRWKDGGRCEWNGGFPQ